MQAIAVTNPASVTGIHSEEDDFAFTGAAVGDEVGEGDEVGCGLGVGWRVEDC